MNIGEANAFFALLRGLETSASEEHQEAAVESAEFLAARGNAAVQAGPRPDQVAHLVVDLQAALVIAADDEDWPVVARLPEPSVQTTPATGGRL